MDFSRNARKPVIFPTDHKNSLLFSRRLIKSEKRGFGGVWLSDTAQHFSAALYGNDEADEKMFAGYDFHSFQFYCTLSNFSLVDNTN